MEYDISKKSAFQRSIKRADNFLEQGAESFVYVFGFYSLLEIFGVKIGKSDYPPKRAYTIFGNTVYRKDFFIYMVPVSNYGFVFRVEQLASYFAKRKEKFIPTIPAGIRMTSGSTELFGVSPKQALGMVIMARNIIDGRQKSFNSMSEMYSYYSSK